MSLAIVPERTAERPAHLIRVVVPRLNKCDHISEYLEQIKTRDYDTEWAEVIETVELDCAGWNDFVTGFLTDREWLAGKGGTNSWAFHNDSREYFKLSPSDQELFKRTAYIYVVAVVAPTGQTIYIDPQGYDYARYVAFPAAELPEGKTRAELNREREKVEAEAKEAALLARINGPAPEVPADHGLRFLWNGLKVNGGGQLHKCSYSQGKLVHYPEGTITIYSSDYVRFPSAVAQLFTIENNSDLQSDYFDDDKVRVIPNHPLYSLVKAAFDAQEAHHQRRVTKLNAKWTGESTAVLQ